MRRIAVLTLLATLGCPPAETPDPLPQLDGDLPATPADSDDPAEQPLDPDPPAEPEPASEDAEPAEDLGGGDLLGAVAGDMALLEVEPIEAPRSDGVSESERLARLEQQAKDQGRSQRKVSAPVQAPAAATAEEAFQLLVDANRRRRYDQAVAGHSPRTQAFMLGSMIAGVDFALEMISAMERACAEQGRDEDVVSIQAVARPLRQIFQRHGIAVPQDMPMDRMLEVTRREAAKVKDKPACVQELLHAMIAMEAQASELAESQPDPPEPAAPWLRRGRVVESQVQGDRGRVRVTSAWKTVWLTAERADGRWTFDLDPKYYPR